MKKIITVIMLAASCSFADTFSVYLENDTLNNSDKYYTHGTRFSYSPDETCSFHLGQLMYTPSDITIAELLEDDRPYGGWLYLNYVRYNNEENWNTYYEYSVGMIGPNSFAGDVQKWVHKTVPGNKDPMGWDNQLENELALQFLGKKEYKWSGDYWSLRPYGTLAIGNVFDYIGAGTKFYYGLNIPSKFIDNTISSKNISNFHAYIGLGCEGRAIARNIFLDGNTFEDSHNVDKEELAGDLQCNFTIGYKSFSMSISHIIRSKEFEKQDKHVEFDSIMLQWDW